MSGSVGGSGGKRGTSATLDPSSCVVFIHEGAGRVVNDGDVALAVVAGELQYGDSFDECEVEPHGVVTLGDHPEVGAVDVHNHLYPIKWAMKCAAVSPAVLAMATTSSGRSRSTRGMRTKGTPKRFATMWSGP